jgi:hypothetical protein
MALTKIVSTFLFGAVIIYRSDSKFTQSFRKNVKEPISKELEKNEVDLVQISRVLFKGIKKSYKDLTTH